MWLKGSTFVKAFDGVVSQGHKELCGPAEVKCQSGAGLTRLLHQPEPEQGNTRIRSVRRNAEAEGVGRPGAGEALHWVKCNQGEEQNIA